MKSTHDEYTSSLLFFLFVLSFWTGKKVQNLKSATQDSLFYIIGKGRERNAQVLYIHIIYKDPFGNLILEGNKYIECYSDWKGLLHAEYWFEIADWRV